MFIILDEFDQALKSSKRTWPLWSSSGNHDHVKIDHDHFGLDDIYLFSVYHHCFNLDQFDLTQPVFKSSILIMIALVFITSIFFSLIKITLILINFILISLIMFALIIINLIMITIPVCVSMIDILHLDYINHFENLIPSRTIKNYQSDQK